MIASLSLLAQMNEQYCNTLIVDGITQQTFLFHQLFPCYAFSYHHGNDLHRCV